MEMQISLWDSDFISLGYINLSGIAESWGSSIFNISEKHPHYFSQQLRPCTLLTVYTCFLFSVFSLTLSSLVFWIRASLTRPGDIWMWFWFVFPWWLLVLLNTFLYPLAIGMISLIWFHMWFQIAIQSLLIEISLFICFWCWMVRVPHIVWILTP